MIRKTIRQRKLAAIILEKGFIPKTSELAEQLSVKIRTIERDLNELADLIPDTAIQDIKINLMLQLRDRVPTMKDGDLIRLAEFFLARKRETKLDSRIESLGLKITIVDDVRASVIGGDEKS